MTTKSDPEHVAILEDIEANTRDTAAAVGVVAAVAETAPTAAERRQPARPPTVTTQAGETVASPTTTQEEERVTAGQRAINAIWEQTQRQIALVVILMAVVVAAGLAAFGPPEAQVAAFAFLYGAANLVIGFYFGRTNHQRVGGVMQGR